ncbi:MAG: MBL fold metallo-hydrolase [Thermoplasmata archaeon]|nr:MBL fold metallo-hydrolase [Thermoplasmata archaeon]
MGFRVTFLGTGGGRHTTMYQTRSTGGLLIEHGGHMLQVDPGPGSLSQMQRIRYDVTETESLIISHCHPDHYSDAESVIEGMTKGGWVRRGSVYGSKTVIEGAGGLGPAISPYHLSKPERTATFEPGDVLDVDGMRVEICRAIHSDPTNVGFRMDTGHGIFSYVSDTEYTDEIADQYVGSRVLLLPVTTPLGNRINYHLCTDDAITFVERVKPELAIFVHLGVVMIRRGPDSEARIVEEKTGVRTIAARDLMTLDVGDELVIGDAETYEGGWIPDSSP